MRQVGLAERERLTLAIAQEGVRYRLYLKHRVFFKDRGKIVTKALFE